ncbi:MAG: hypothetical protein J0M10_16485 [Chitinophagales bacterium]|nr:hypothetical protein [Chitinophagales bacterium]
MQPTLVKESFDMIVNRNIVVRRVGNSLILPSTKVIELEVDRNVFLPVKEFIMFRVVSYDENSGKLGLKINSDIVNEGAFWVSFEENSNILSTLNINSVEITNPPKRNTEFIQPISSITNISKIENKNIRENQTRIWESIKTEQAPKQAQKAIITLQLPVKDLIFSNGKVSFEYYIEQIRRKSSFDIPHLFLKTEHDSIKNYFPNILKIKHFTISVEFEYLENRILNYSARSAEISLINELLFDQVEDLLIQDYIVNSTDEEIYTLDEIASELSKKTGLDESHDGQRLLNKLFSKDKTKHYYHLRYLSDKHLTNIMTINLTAKPMSFIFLLPYQNNYCIVWETYSTNEATYAWKIDHKPQSQLMERIQEIVDRIKWLRNKNKMTYLRTKPENFMRIEHEYSGDDFGFKKWKSQIESFLQNTPSNP